MLELLRLDQYDSDVLTLMMFFVISGGAVVGYITDAVMADRGFGPVGNALLIILGCLLGIYVRNAHFGLMKPGDIITTAIFAAASATLLLMLLGIAKFWVRD